MQKLDLAKLDLIFDEFNHRYVLDGRWVPGVSSISGTLPKEWLANWAAKEVVGAVRSQWLPEKAYTTKEIEDILYFAKGAHNRKKEQAADKGTEAHGWFETYVKSGIEPALPADPAVLNAVNRFREWRDEVKVEWVSSELVVGSRKHKFAGKLDAIAVINGRTALADFKTSNGIFPEYYVQTAGYQLALEEMGLAKILTALGLPPMEDRWILRFPKAGNDFEARLVPTTFAADKKAFLCARGIYEYLSKQDKTNQWPKK